MVPGLDTTFFTGPVRTCGGKKFVISRLVAPKSIPSSGDVSKHLAAEAPLRQQHHVSVIDSFHNSSFLLLFKTFKRRLINIRPRQNGYPPCPYLEPLPPGGLSYHLRRQFFIPA